MYFLCLVEKDLTEHLLRSLRSVWSYDFQVATRTPKDEITVKSTSGRINQNGLTVMTAYCNGFKSAMRVNTLTQR